MLVSVKASQIPFSPRAVRLRAKARGIREPVKIILIRLQSFVFPRPEIAPPVTISTHMKGSPTAMMVR